MIKKISLTGASLMLMILVSLLAGPRDGWAVIQEFEPGDRVVGTLNADQDTLPFYAYAGSSLRVTVQATFPLAVTVSLTGSNGQAVAGLTPTTVSDDRTEISGVIPTTGRYTIVIAAANGTAGNYTMQTTGGAPRSFKGTGNVAAAGEQTIEFTSTVAGSLLKSIKIKANADTLQLNAAGVLTDPDGAVVAVDSQTAKGTTLVAANALLAKAGTYQFKFTPEGTGSYTYRIGLKLPKLSRLALTLSPDRLPLTPPAATGISVQVSAPPDGTMFVAGDKPWVTVVLKDDAGNPLTAAQLSSLGLYMYGPQKQSDTTAALNLLRAESDRAKRPHHYIDLLTHPDAIWVGNTVHYPLSAVAAELPGTYTVGARGVLAADSLQQWFGLADCQIKTATVETQLVEKDNCGSCHFGPVSGKFYMHHIDGSASSPNGSQSIDQWPVRTCKQCHNQDGYAAFTDPRTGNRVSDSIVRRVHGVHHGEELKAPEDIYNYLTITNVVGAFSVGDTVTGGTSGASAEVHLVPTNNTYLAVGEITGTFKANETLFNGAGATAKFLIKRNGIFTEYTEVLFPADDRNCTTCHVDDRWKTQPSRQACGACHDRQWFGAPSELPLGWKNHPGGPQSSEADCLVCHGPGKPEDIAVKHDPGTPPMNTISVTMTPPNNELYYVAGETPAVTLVINNDAGAPIPDHTQVTDVNFSTASFFVYGPRSLSLPVLTSTAKNGISKARASVSSSIAGPWAGLNGKSITIAVNGSAPLVIPFSGSEPLTVAEAVASLNAVVTNYNAKATASGSNVNLRSNLQGGDSSRFEIYNGDITTAMGWKRGNVILEPDITIGALSTPANDLRALADPLDYSDPMVTRNVANVTYQLDDVAGLTPGTYFVYVYTLPRAGKIAGLTRVSLGFATFQVGTATAEKKIATNCTDCHGDTIWHLYEGPVHPAPFDADYCKACHDYSHYAGGDMFKNQGGTSLSGWSGYGAAPISRRVHGVHFAHYLEHSEEIYANATKDTFGPIIFPQDIRNCTKCHAETSTWTQKPSRVACLACHDSDEAKAHGKIMTYIPDPEDPYGPTAEESCEVCHGEGADFAPSKVHSISNPYKPPYLREPAE